MARTWLSPGTLGLLAGSLVLLCTASRSVTGEDAGRAVAASRGLPS